MEYKLRFAMVTENCLPDASRRAGTLTAQVREALARVDCLTPAEAGSPLMAWTI